MSKFNIGVGEDFPLDEMQEGCREHRGRHNRHRHHGGHDHHQHDHDHHHARLAAMAFLFALKAHRCSRRAPGENS